MDTKVEIWEKEEETAKGLFCQRRSGSQGSSGSDWPMFTVADPCGKCKELIVPVAIDGKTVDMELDTGTSITIIPKSIWTDVLTSKPVERTDVKLRSYSGHKILIIREGRVQVAYRDQEAVILRAVITGNDDQC